MRRRLPLLILLALACVGLLLWLTWTDRRPDRSRVSRGPQPSPTGRQPAGEPATTSPLVTEERVHAHAEGRLVVRGTWGGAQGQFGRSAGNESNPEAPMSLLVDRVGNVHVLDQVNRRVQRFGPDGKLVGALELGRDTVQDLLVDKQGRTLLLDRLGEAGIDVVGADGRRGSRLPVVGGLVREGGGITGLFADDAGIYVEVDHDDLVRVADAAGRPSGMTETIPGRPSRDGRLYLKAGVIEKGEGRVFVQAHGRDRALVWESPLNLGRPLLHILLLDSDLSGRVYLAAEVGEEDPATHAMRELATVVARLSPEGRLTGSLTLPPTTEDPAETFRPLAVGDDGTIYHLVPTAGELRITAYTFP